MKRREMLLTTGAAVFGLSTFPFGWTAAAEKKKQKLLYFTRSAGFEHSAVKRSGDELSFSEKTLTEMGERAGFEVECTKDGRVFDGDLDQYDAIAFYTSGDLTKPNKNNTPPMSPEGKQKLLAAIAAGKGFVGFHAATDSFRSQGIDPYIAMVGAEFCGHGAQQEATVLVASPKFPGAEGLGESFALREEWYAHKKIAGDLHVILVQDTKTMTGKLYERPPFPATWARMHSKGRVFYTSFGHREDVWTNPKVQQLMLGGIAWAMGNVDADVTPNIDQVTPQANQLPT
jgi:type 1 glutamine amidotransferase